MSREYNQQNPECCTKNHPVASKNQWHFFNGKIY